MSNTATELIAHLEAGGLIASGEPSHPQFLRLEIYGEKRVKHLGCYGWGSALFRPEERLASVLESPHVWVCVPIEAKPPDHEAAAEPLLAKLGEYVDYEWQLTASDRRPVNTAGLENPIASALKEIERLREGNFTPEEFQNLCHSKTVQEGFEAFARGCQDYQQKLFGKCDRLSTDDLAAQIPKVARALYQAGAGHVMDKHEIETVIVNALL
jgi:hypothetical protein